MTTAPSTAATPTDAERQLARNYWRAARHPEDAIAQALADQRARYEALADELDAISDEHWAAYKHGDLADARRGSAYTEGFCVGYGSAAQRIRQVSR